MRRLTTLATEGGVTAQGFVLEDARYYARGGHTVSLGLANLERYTIRHKLGEGGMGVVYLAYDRERGTEVALKTLARMTPGAAYRLKHEFRALADLSHPNLVSLHELVAGPDRLFFAMELVNGVSFTRYVRRRTAPLPTPPGNRPTFPVARGNADAPSVSRASSTVGSSRRCVADEERLRPCLIQLCDAVAFLHQQGRLHRDLKPSNVLVTPQGRVVVLDFGLVRHASDALHDQTPDLAVVGTPTYMAPEQAMCMAIRPAADWYAVGTILFESLTGRLPFEGTPEDVLGRKRFLDVQPPSVLVDDVPSDLDALCAELLQHDARLRPRGPEVLRRVKPSSSHVARRPRPSSVSPPSASAFIGRTRELSFLDEALTEVRPGRPVLVRLKGRSGMGKSTLVRKFLGEVAERRNAVILKGRCHERESVPYKAFDQLVDGLSHYLRQLPAEEATALMPRDVQVLARVFPVLLRVEAVASSPRRDVEVRDDHELRRRAFAALKEHLARIADRQILVLHIDDLQWGDVDSVELLVELLAPPDAPAMLVVCSHRSEGACTTPALTALDALRPDEVHGPVVHEMEVEPLPPDAAMDVLRAQLQRSTVPSQDRLAQIAIEAEGVPFLLEAFARHLNEGHGVDRIRLQDVLHARLGALSPEAHRLLEVVAASGRPVPQAVVWRAAGVEEQGEAAVQALRGQRLVWTQGMLGPDLVDTYHERIREHVLAELGSDRLRRWHLRLATALRQEGEVDDDAIAQHFDAGGEPAQAVHHAVEAARRASEAFAFDRAAQLFRFALARVGDDDARRLTLLEGLADALRKGGRGVEAGRAHVRAAGGASGERVLEHWRCAAEQLLRSGHVDEALQVAEPLLRACGLRLPATRVGALASVLWLNARLRLRGLSYVARHESEVPTELLRRIDTCWSVGHGLVAVNAIEAGDLVTRAALLALEAGEPGRVARTLAFQAIMMVLAGLSGHERVLEVAERAATCSDDAYAKALTTGTRGFVEFMVRGEMDLNYRLMTEAEASFRTLDWAANFEISTAHFQMLASLFYMGRWRDMRARFAGYVREAERRGDLYGAATLVLLYGDVPSLMRDDPRSGSALVESYLSRWRERDGDLQLSLGLQCQIRLRVYEGTAHASLSHVEARVRAAHRAGLLRGKWIRMLMLEGRARALVAAALEGPPQDRAHLLRRAVEDVHRMRRTGHPTALAFAEMHRGAIAFVAGDREEGMEALGRAAGRLRALGMHMHAWCCTRVVGLVQGGEDGRRRVRDADRFMRGEGVVAPDRLAHVLVPHGTPDEGR